MADLDFKKDAIAIYRSCSSDDVFLVRCGHFGSAYLNYAAALALVSELLHPDILVPKERTLKPLAEITYSLFNLPSKLSEPAPSTMELAGQSAAAFANAAHQPSNPAFSNKPFGVGPAVLVSDDTLKQLERCKVCFLGVIKRDQRDCGRASCPYDEIPF